MSFSCFLVGAIVARAAASAHVQSAAPLRVMGFSGSSNWPIFVAQEKGLFARHSVEAGLMAAPSSATQLARLIEGRIEIAMTAMDNVVAYEEGDVFAFLGVTNGGRLNLMVAPTVKSYADLKGRTLAVDAPSTGYSLVLMGTLVRYIRAYVAAVDWLYDPANRAEAMDILQRRLADVSPDNAARSYDELLHPSRGSLSRKAAIDPEGVRTVLALRREFARPARPLSDPSRYYDPTYYERALRNE